MMSWNCDAIFLQKCFSCRFYHNQTFYNDDRHHFLISYLDGIRSVKVSGKKVNGMYLSGHGLLKVSN